jgi:CHASE3 domain sensor protein
MISFSNASTICTVLILVCIASLSFWSELRNESDRVRLTHAYLAAERLQAIRIDSTQTGAGQRAYISIGTDRYLELYGAGLDRMRRNLKELSALNVDNSGQWDAVTRLHLLDADRGAQLADGIEVQKHSGLPAGAEAMTPGNCGELEIEPSLPETFPKVLNAESKGSRNGRKSS